jgi:hypothetical protein
MSNERLYVFGQSDLRDALHDTWFTEPLFRSSYIEAVRRNRPLRRSSFSDFEWELIMATKDDENVDQLVTDVNRQEDALHYSLDPFTTASVD